MSSTLVTTGNDTRGSRGLTVLQGPVWSLRVEGRRVSIVLQGAPLPGSAVLSELVIHLPHVGFPFDFREGLERFRHHRGQADLLEVSVDARVLLDWLHRVSGGRLGGTAYDDTLVLSGRTRHGARYTVRARIIVDPEREDVGEPTLTLSLYQVRIYGIVTEPWPVLAGRVIDLLPKELVVDRSLTTARLRLVRPVLAYALSALGWKLPDVSRLQARGVELREGRLIARFVREGADAGPWLTLDTMDEGGLRGAFERFVEDLELKRHHGQVDRLLAERQIREALAEVYRALDGPPRPGFLAERLIGICASQPILYDEGERVCHALLRLSPSYEPALCGLASIALGRGRREEAAVQLERLASLLTGPADREDATAADLSVAEILRSSAADEARAALERVLERSPDHEEALEALIAMSDSEADLRLTLPLYKRLLFAARSPARTRDAGLRLARHSLERGQPEDARVFLRVVLDTNPDDLEAQLALAEVESHSGDDAEAARILDAALRVVPASDGHKAVRIIERLASLALERLGDPGRARRVLWRAVDLTALDAESALALGRLALSAAEPSLAERYLEAIPQKHARWPEAQALRAEASLERGDAERALAALTAALDVSPASEAALALVERCTPEPGQRERLIHQLTAAAAKLAGSVERARVLRHIGALYESIGLGFDAIAPYEAALDQAPTSYDAAHVAGRLIALYAGYGMWSKHQELCRVRLSRYDDPDKRVELLVRLGRVALTELSDPTAARPFLEEAVRLAPRHLEALELLRTTLEALERGVALIAVLLRLESVHPDEDTRDEVRLRLAELQLEGLAEPGQARATLQRLPEALSEDPRVIALRRRAGLPVPEAAVAAAGAPPEREYDQALRLADSGELDAALTLLRALLERHPDHIPASELAGLLTEQLRGIPHVEQGPPRSPVVGGHRILGASAPGDLAAAPSPRTSRVATQPTGGRPPQLDRALGFESPPLVAAAPAVARSARAARTESTQEFVAPPAAFDAPLVASDESPTERTPRSIYAAGVEALEAPTAALSAPLGRLGPVSPRPENTQEFEAPPLDATPTESAAALARVRGDAPRASGAAATLQQKADEARALDEAMDAANEALAHGEARRAMDALERALAVDPDFVPALELRVRVSRALDDHRAQAEALERLLDNTFDAERSADLLRALGLLLYERLDDPAGALERWRRYLFWRPRDEEIFGRVRGALTASGDLSPLAELYERLAEVWEDAMADGSDPRRASREALAALGAAISLYLQVDEPDLAVAAAERATTIAPGDPEAMEQYARALVAAGRAAEARVVVDALGPLLLDGPHKDALLALVTP